MTTALDDAINLQNCRRKSRLNSTEVADNTGITVTAISRYECGTTPLTDLAHRLMLESLYSTVLPPVDDPQISTAPNNIGEILPRARKTMNNMTEHELAELIGVGPETIKGWENGNKMFSSSILKVTRFFLLAEAESAKTGIHVKFITESIQEAKINQDPYFDGTTIMGWAAAESAVQNNTPTVPTPSQRATRKHANRNKPTVIPAVVTQESASTERKRLALIRVIVSATDDKLDLLSDYTNLLYNELYGELR
ncbi:MAG TPA: XRE family transcriptional regulator [Dehalococcoidia bacterium]|nr:XRE family transcriptional regulator [Dehalococcoidia bacterium]